MASKVASSCGQLCLRSTFIDIEGDMLQDEAGSARRSRSVPAAHSRTDAAEVFAGERAYIFGLREKLASQWAAAPEGRQELGRAAVRGSSAELLPPLASVANPAVSEMLLRTKVGAPEGDIAPTDGGATRTPSSGEGSDRAESVAEAADAAAQSRGSVGHPFICSRPCLYHASGKCNNAAACDFCHLQHPKRPGHLDKKHREALRDMPPTKAKALMFPIVREKVLALDPSPASVQLLDRLASAFGVTTTVQSPSASRGDRTLVVALSAMSLRVVLASLQRAAPECEARARAVAEELMAQLRCAIAPDV